MLRMLLAAAAAGSLIVSGACGAEELLPALESVGGITPSEIARLIGQLDAPEFGQRQEASRRLSEVGKSVLPEIEKAVIASSREVSSRALDILKFHFQRGDADVKQAAKESLARLADSKNVSISQRAHNVIDPPKDWSSSPQFGFRGPGLIAPLPAPAPATQTISISDINGHREIKITDEARVGHSLAGVAGVIDRALEADRQVERVERMQLLLFVGSDLDRGLIGLLLRLLVAGGDGERGQQHDG